MTNSLSNIKLLYDKALNGNRLTPDEGKLLFTDGDLLAIGQIAHHIRLNKTNPEIGTYIIDRNINYTNICTSKCQFCAFYKKSGDDSAYVLDNSTIIQKLQETESLGGTGILLQGGLNPDLKIDYYLSLIQLIKSHSNLHIHAFSPPEILYISELEGIPLKETLKQFIESGLDSIPGGGAEILDDVIRQKISPRKYKSDQWLSVMETAHQLGLKTTATMMFGHIETIDNRISHLEKLRALQDRTGGFTAFIPWTFQSKNTKLNTKLSYSYDYLKTLAISRIYLDNFQNIQGSWVTQGEQIGQVSLHFGANDLGSIMIEENVVKSAGTSYKINEKRMKRLIFEAGFLPYKRNSLYTNLP